MVTRYSMAPTANGVLQQDWGSSGGWFWVYGVVRTSPLWG
jgi:hypothetical protein